MEDLFNDMDSFATAAHAGGDEVTSSRPERRVWKISALTREIKLKLEGGFGLIWVEGEISNFRRPASGHAYFTLKDEDSQLRAVMFNHAFSALPFPVRDGQLVRGYGQITVYERTGDYQIRLNRLEPAGEGEKMLQLEALKKRLAAEGLFDAARKRPLPALARHVGVVTSPTGAAIRDILNVLNRRFANLHVLIAPARVQGEGAAAEIVAGIEALNRIGGLDVLIVGRGGGSLEDLWCFNEECVVRAIVASRIPVISAVGHEIDTPLSDYAADVRAPTPSAAAELVVRGKGELEQRVATLQRRLILAPRASFSEWRRRLDRAAQTPGIAHPRRLLETRAQSVDLLSVRLQKALAGIPEGIRQRAATALRRMTYALHSRQTDARHALARIESQLRLLNPRAVLQRGYSLTRLADGRLLHSPAEAPDGTLLTTEVAEGTLTSIVRKQKEGAPHGGERNWIRESPDPAGDHRNRDGKRKTRPGKNGRGLRGGPEAGQAVLFEIE